MSRWLALIVAVAAAAAPAVRADAPFSAGVAVIDVTPPVGYRMAGNFAEKRSTGTRDPLFAKALYVAQGDAKFLLIVCDVCGLNPTLTGPARDRIAKDIGVPRAAISVTATHTHGGPAHADPVFVPLLAARAKAAGQPDLHTLGDYPTKFVDGVVAAGIAAFKNARPATIAAGIGTVPGLAFNRRFHMKDGTVRFNPGKLNPGIVRPAGPVDESLPLVKFLDAGTSKPFASLCAFAMHTAVYGGSAVSADYPGHLQLALRKEYGPDFVSLFAEGCAGDVNHFNVSVRDPHPMPEAVAAVLAKAFIATKTTPTPARVRTAAGVVPALLKADRPADLAVSRDTLVGERYKQTQFLDHVEAYTVLMVNHMRQVGPTRPLDVQAVVLSPDVAVATLPHEVFVELGLEIKARSPFKITLIATLANEVDVYVPTKKAFAEGSYETVNSPYAPGVGEAMVEQAVTLLKGLK